MSHAPMPEGRRPRGRTRPGRLAFVDRFLSRALALGDAPAQPPIIIDVGVGEHAWTTAELRHAVHAAGVAARVIGVELDPQRAAAARRHDPAVEIQEGDALADPPDRLPRAAIVRAMNLLRDLTPDRARAAHQQLAKLLAPGGLLLEGNCSRDGDRGCLHVLRQGANSHPVREGLLMYTSFARGCGPWLFRDQLPRDLRHSCRPGHPIHSLLSRWQTAFEAAGDASQDTRSRFSESLRLLAGDTPGVDLAPELLSAGYCWYRPPGGIPAG